ncbi:methyl-accepting chemotaxis protein [Vibrio sp. NTOU-M3]|uniref:methyl-accepting chemotaxis protein n=1 Tax=Vibrio sp. NTOU-M3 TaxID=3234954 RepID=UPI00349F6966
MFQKLSLKNKLAFSASVAIIIGGLMVEALSFNGALKRLDIELLERLESTTASYNQNVQDWLVSKERILTAFPSNADSLSVLNHLKQVRDSAGFDNVFLAYPDGSQNNANGVVLPQGNDDPREWGWYQNAMAVPDKVFMDNPTIAAATGANVVSLGKTLDFNNEKVVLGADIEIKDLVNSMNDAILPGDGYLFIVNKEGNIFIHQNLTLLNKPVAQIGLNFSDIKEASVTGKDLYVDVNGEKSVIHAHKIDGTTLSTVTVINYASLVEPLNDAMLGQILATAIVVIICTLLFYLLCKVFFRPLNNVSEALEQIANGSGDLTQRITVESQDEVGKLAQNFNTFVASLQQLIGHVRDQSSQLTERSEQSAQRAQRTESEVHHQQQDITMLATAVTELSSATQEIALHADNTADAAQKSAQNTNHGHTLVGNTKQSISYLANELVQANGVIGELNRHALDISTVLSTIRDIAEQTNLLALNAAIEAARAGEQGRGFAVVADEVRVLSQRTRSSTEEIKSTIDTLQGTTERAVSLMENSSRLANHSVTDADNAAQALEEIREAVTLISDMATHIATAAEEQTHVTGEITQNITSIKDVAEQLVLSSKDSTEESGALKLQAENLSAKVATFKLS